MLDLSMVHQRKCLHILPPSRRIFHQNDFAARRMNRSKERKCRANRRARDGGVLGASIGNGEMWHHRRKYATVRRKLWELTPKRVRELDKRLGWSGLEIASGGKAAN